MNGSAAPLVRLDAAFKVARQLYPGWSIQRLSILLLVGMQPGVAMGELMVKAKVSASSVSRNVSELENTHGLVRTETDPLDSRRLLVRPTSEGMGFLERICGLALPG